MIKYRRVAAFCAWLPAFLRVDYRQRDKRVLPWVVTRVIALKDYLMMMLGRIGGVGLLEKAFENLTES